MGQFRRLSVTVPVELADAIDNKAAKDGVTRQQLMTALLDLGLHRTTYPDRGGVIGVMKAIELIRRVEGKSSDWSRDQLREALWGHLTALVTNK